MRRSARQLSLRAASILFHAVCNRDYADRYTADHGNFRSGLASTEEFFRRFRGSVNIENKDVLDFGCGMGSTCVYVALRGACSVVGIDKQAEGIDLADRVIAEEYPHLASTVRFAVASDVSTIQPNTFDVVISKDSTEHYDHPQRT